MYMEKYIDLHTHTTFSDGELSPLELVRLSANNNLCAIAITDHNSISGVSEAVREAEKYMLEVVPGIELSAYSDVELHILGYFIDVDSKLLNDYLKKRHMLSMNELIKIFAGLSSYGIKIKPQDVLKRYKILNVKSVIQYLLQENLVNSIDDAHNLCYSLYPLKNRLTQNSPLPEECINLIHDSGGIAFLAHPIRMGKSDSELEEIIKCLKRKGLDGIECIHSEHSSEFSHQCISWARKYDLLISGGSDYHGGQKKEVELGYVNGRRRIRNDYLTYMKNYIQHRNNTKVIKK